MKDAKALRQEAVAVATRLHDLTRKDAVIREASTTGALVGITLYSFLAARALGLGTRAVHELVDAINHDFPVMELTGMPPEARKLAAALAADDVEAAMRVVAEILGVAPKVDEKAVADADARADEIIRKAAEAFDKKGD